MPYIHYLNLTTLCRCTWSSSGKTPPFHIHNQASLHLTEIHNLTVHTTLLFFLFFFSQLVTMHLTLIGVNMDPAQTQIFYSFNHELGVTRMVVLHFCAGWLEQKGTTEGGNQQVIGLWYISPNKSMGCFWLMSSDTWKSTSACSSYFLHNILFRL